MYTKQHLPARPGVSGLGRGGGVGSASRGLSRGLPRADQSGSCTLNGPEAEARSEDRCSSKSKEPQPKVIRLRGEKGQARGGGAGSNGEQSWSCTKRW